MTRTTDSSASILARLRNLSARYPRLPRASMLLLYAQQGLLARLAASSAAQQFVLKGALSLFTRYGEAARPTEDMDLAASALPNTPAAVLEVMQQLCQVPFADGLQFDPQEITVRVINEALAYPGVQVMVVARLGASRVPLQIDVSFGNEVTPGPVTLAFPALLIPEPVRVRVYPLETVVTEKFAALVEIGVATTRMKDLYDLWVILGRESFEAEIMQQALQRSFAARQTPVQDIAVTLSPAVSQNPLLITRWAQYRRRTGLSALEFETVMALVEAFYRPLLLEGLTSGAWIALEQRWQPRIEADVTVVD